MEHLNISIQTAFLAQRKCALHQHITSGGELRLQHDMTRRRPNKILKFTIISLWFGLSFSKRIQQLRPGSCVGTVSVCMYLLSEYIRILHKSHIFTVLGHYAAAAHCAHVPPHVAKIRLSTFCCWCTTWRRPCFPGHDWWIHDAMCHLHVEIHEFPHSSILRVQWVNWEKCRFGC